jgi:hypothetical protein
MPEAGVNEGAAAGWAVLLTVPDARAPSVIVSVLAPAFQLRDEAFEPLPP